MFEERVKVFSVPGTSVKITFEQDSEGDVSVSCGGATGYLDLLLGESSDKISELGFPTIKQTPVVPEMCGDLVEETNV